jgi:tetratricopeptide (TPR) repeat protein
MFLRSALAIILVTAFAPAVAADAFSLTLHVNGGADTTLYRGEPLLVQALLILEQEEAATVALADGQAWTRALSLTVRDGAGQPVQLPWAILGAAPAASLSFTPEAAEISAVMGLAPDALDALAPGDYRLDAVFSTKESAAEGAWKGVARAPGLVLRVSADPRADSAPEQVYKHRLLARWHHFNDRPEEALAQLDAAVQRQPDDIQVLSDKAEVLAEMNRGDAAVETLQQAISLYRQRHPDASHPPRWLLHRLQELEADRVAAAGTASDAAPSAQVAPIAAAPPAVTPPAAAAASQPADEAAAGPRHWVGDQAVPAESSGQWAASAQAGSQYGGGDYSAMRAAGAPDVPGADDHPNAWCPAVRDSGSDWLELTFERAAPATEVRVRQSFGPGAIVKVEAIAPGGQAHTWWEGKDPYGQDGFAEDAVWFGVRVPLTAYEVQKIRLTLDLGAHGRWKQIDAVQLIGATPR